MKESFPQLSGQPFQTVLKDPWHLMDSYKVSPKHPLYKVFLGYLRDAIFLNNPDGRNMVLEELEKRISCTDKIDLGRKLLSVPSKYFFRGNKVRRLIPEVLPKILMINFSTVFWPNALIWLFKHSEKSILHLFYE